MIPGRIAQRVGPSLAGQLTSVADYRAAVTPASAAAVFGANLKADWDVRSGTAANTWTDTVSSLVFTGTNSPVLGVDTGFFNGLSVWQISGTMTLDTGALVAALVAADAPFYVCLIVRQPAPGTNQRIFNAYNSAGSASVYQLWQNTAAPGVLRTTRVSTTVNSQVTSGDRVHRFELGSDGTNEFIIIRDGVQLTSSGAAVSPAALQRISLPISTNSGSSCNYAVVRVADVWPSAAQRAQMRAYDKPIFGTV